MPRLAALIGALLGTAALLGTTALPILASSATAHPRGTSASSLRVKDEGHLHLVKSSGSLLIDEGSASGTIPGRVKVWFTYNGNPTVSAQITIYGRSGSIDAHGSGRLSSPTSPSPSFNGTLTISGGSGRYARSKGSGHLYGVFYRRSYGMTVQTEGSLHY
jgi:hypothetical protein